jgi:DNA uptake protein ComE-like DNA-binding protein
MKYIVLGITMSLLTLTGCAPSSPSPDQIRQNTAKATAAAARDTKAMAQGVFEGLRAKGPMNINRASKDQLETLPGIDSAAADRIIAARPYKDSAELRTRHIITKTEYNRISTRIEAR